MRKHLIVIALVVLFFNINSAYAATAIGSGYKCSGKTIKKGSSTVSAAAAKSALKDKLKAAKAKLKKLQNSNASEDELVEQQDAVSGLEQSILYIGLCSKGKLDGLVDNYWKTLGKFFEGPYTISPYGITENASFGFAIYGNKLTGSLNLGGLNLSPLQFRGNAGIELNPVGSTFPAKFQDKGTQFGDMSFVINKDGPFTIDITNVPTNVLGITHIVVSGNRVGDTMTAEANLRNSSETSVATLQFNLQAEQF